MGTGWSCWGGGLPAWRAVLLRGPSHYPPTCDGIGEMEEGCSVPIPPICLLYHFHSCSSCMAALPPFTSLPSRPIFFKFLTALTNFLKHSKTWEELGTEFSAFLPLLPPTAHLLHTNWCGGAACHAWAFYYKLWRRTYTHCSYQHIRPHVLLTFQEEPAEKNRTMVSPFPRPVMAYGTLLPLCMPHLRLTMHLRLLCSF